MKHIIVAIFLVSGMLFAQSPIEKTVGEFKELKVYDLIEVKLVKSTVNKIKISGENANDVVVVNRNGVLKIRMNLEESFDGNKTQVTLYCTNVDIVDANEGAYIHSEDNFKQYDLTLKAQEGGLVKLRSETSFLEIKSTSGGNVEASGNSKKQKVTLNTGGIYRGEALKTEQTEVSITAAGEAYVNASTLVDVKIRVGGDVYIYGNPATVNESKAIGGRVKRID